jgi:hypothetical protein
MDKEIISIIKAQTEILFLNLDETLNALEEEQLYDTKICDWPLAEQVYHMLNSLERWFINPADSRKAAADLHKPDKKLTKTELVDYLSSIRTKISVYLEGLSPDSLTGYSQGCPFDRLTLILGQSRHLMYHIGLIHGCLRVNSGGRNPAYRGLTLPDK